MQIDTAYDYSATIYFKWFHCKSVGGRRKYFHFFMRVLLLHKCMSIKKFIAILFMSEYLAYKKDSYELLLNNVVRYLVNCDIRDWETYCSEIWLMHWLYFVVPESFLNALMFKAVIANFFVPWHTSVPT